MCEIGDFSAFTKPKQLVAYFIIDPSVKQSGKFIGNQVKMSKRGSRISRRILFVIAITNIRCSKNGKVVNPVLKEYYNSKLESKPKKVAIGALMRKVTNIIFAVLRNDSEFKIITPKEHVYYYNKKLDLIA